jgi:hypothetical protein
MKGMKDYLLILLVIALFIAGSTIVYHEEVAPYEEEITTCVVI